MAATSYTYTLGVVAEEVKRIQSTIQRIEQAMHHASPATIDALRRDKEQLQNVFNFIMSNEIFSDVSIPNLLESYKTCVQECIGSSYNDKKGYIGWRKDIKMKFTFGDVYTSLQTLEQVVQHMGIDADNAFDDESKGIINDELRALKESYMKLYNTDISMKINLDSIRRQLDSCMPNIDVY